MPCTRMMENIKLEMTRLGVDIFDEQNMEIFGLTIIMLPILKSQSKMHYKQ